MRSKVLSLFSSGSFAYKHQINPRAIFVDPTGAILISIYIIFTWIGQANGEYSIVRRIIYAFVYQ